MKEKASHDGRISYSSPSAGSASTLIYIGLLNALAPFNQHSTHSTCPPVLADNHHIYTPQQHQPSSS